MRKCELGESQQKDIACVGRSAKYVVCLHLGKLPFWLLEIAGATLPVRLMAEMIAVGVPIPRHMFAKNTINKCTKIPPMAFLGVLHFP